MKKQPARMRIVKSRLARNILTLFSGKAAAQVLLVGTSPIIARLFTPADFGVAALLLAITAVAAPLATLGYGTAAQLAEKEADARRLIMIVLAITSLFALVMACLIFGDSTFGPRWFSRFCGWEWSIPFLFLLHGVESALESWNTRMKQFKLQASTYVSGTVIGTGSRILFGAIGGSSVSGLIAGYILGLATRVAVLARGSSVLRRLKKQEAGVRAYRNLILQYKDFPLFATPTALLHIGSNKLPLLFFGTLYSPAAAGFYAMAQRLFLQPLMLLHNSFRSVYTQHLITAVHHKRPITPILWKACAFTGGLMLIPSLLLANFGEYGVVFLLGEKWQGAGVFVEITAPLMFFASLAVPANVVMVVLRQQGRLLVFQVVTTAALAMGFLMSYLVWGTSEAALRTLVSIFAVRHSYILWVSYSVARSHELSIQSGV